MTKSKINKYPEKLNLIIEALKEVKGKEIVVIDIQNLGYAVSDYFVICHGDSSTQVDGLSNSVERKLKKEIKTSAHHIEGKTNSLWVLMDYSDIIVHIFQKENRSFYNLEDLWAEGVSERIEDYK